MKLRFPAIGLISLLFNISLNAQVTVSLKDAINLARKNNPFYKTEKLNIDIAQAAITTASTHSNPTFNFSVQQIPSPKNYAPGTGFFSSENRQVTYQVGKSIPINGQRRYKIEEAKSDLSLTQTNLSDYERNLLNDVSQKWLDVWYATQKLNIIKRAKVNSDTLLATNKIRLKNQVITTTEFARTQIISEQYNLLKSDIQQELSSANKELAFLLGIDDSIQINDNQVLLTISIPDNFDSLLNYALQNRTDIQASRRAADKAKIEAMLQQSNKYQAPEVGMTYSTQNKIVYIGAYIALPIPIFDKNKGEITRAKVSLDQSKGLVDANVEKAKSEIENTYKEYLTNKANFVKYNELYGKSENVLTIVKMSYLKGGTTILDYLEAEKSWFEMQNQYYESLYNYRKSYLQLLVASNLIQNIQ
ncbi:MAG: TolC family protein [Bacteroidota bacterium]|nr:TolC family protein [Bacteroidota bacterium]